MKYLLTILFLSVPCFATEFWDFSCSYIRPPDINKWVAYSGRVNSVKKSIGWSAQTQSGQYFATYKDQTQLGVCAETANLGDRMVLTVYFTTGKNLNFFGNGCGFIGDSLKGVSFYKDVDSSEEYLLAETEVKTADGPVGELVIAGISPTQITIETVIEHCQKIFDKEKGPQANATQPVELPQIKVKYREQAGSQVVRFN